MTVPAHAPSCVSPPATTWTSQVTVPRGPRMSPRQSAGPLREADPFGLPRKEDACARATPLPSTQVSGLRVQAGLSLLLEKRRRGDLSLQAQGQERRLTSSFSCFLEPGQDSPDFSTLFSSPPASPSLFSGGRATAGGGE